MVDHFQDLGGEKDIQGVEDLFAKGPVVAEGRGVRVASLIVLFIYTIIDAFYFEAVVSGISSRFYQSTLDLWLVAGGTIIMFYLPFRIFFALYSGRQWLGWITFALSVLIVFLNIVTA